MSSMKVAYIFMLSFTAVSALSTSDPETLHSLAKRDNVCGANFRSGVDKESCLPRGTGYQLTPPSTIKAIPLSTTSLPNSTFQCDHTIELQLLDHVLQSSGVCDVVKAIVDAGGGNKAGYLEPAFDTISGIDNLNFLDKTVNNRKKTVVARSYKGQHQQNTGLDVAVGNYLQQTKGESENVADALDTDVQNIIAHANTLYAKLPGGTGRSKEARVKNELGNAIAAYNAKKAQTVRAAWDKVLTDAPHT